MYRRLAFRCVPLFALLLSACATTHSIEPQLASAASFAKATPVEIVLTNFAFTPEDIRLEAGKPYALTIRNAASGGHDFTALEFFAAAQVMSQDAEMVRSGQIELKGGKSATVHLMPSKGTFSLDCTHLGHELLGTSGTIVVE